LLQTIIIATDSAYLVDALTEHIEGWIKKSGIGSSTRGQPVKHYEKLKELHDLMNDMEYNDDDGGIVVQLWKIDRQMNQSADALANAALDGN
jgi:ribonuclease HI